MGKYNKKKDSNQSEIVKAFTSVYWSVWDASHVGDGFPDLVVGGILKEAPFTKVTYLVEIKTDTGTLETTQEDFKARHRGPFVVVRNVSDVARVVRGDIRGMDT